MEYLFLIILFIIAALYSSVGHGGASGYLALMAIFGVEQYLMKSSALTLNLFVSGISFISFYKDGHFKFKVLLPFIITSIPMAFLGAKMNIDPKLYKTLLGIFLLIAVSRFFFSKKGEYENSREPHFSAAMLIGAFIGFFSGMIGIGGGIILSPILLLLHWSNAKETAGISALFIFLNSTSGLIGLFHNQNFEPSSDIIFWAIIGLFGGLVGGLLSSRKLSHSNIKLLLTSVLLIASLKLFIFQ